MAKSSMKFTAFIFGAGLFSLFIFRHLQEDREFRRRADLALTKLEEEKSLGKVNGEERSRNRLKRNEIRNLLNTDQDAIPPTAPPPPPPPPPSPFGVRDDLVVIYNRVPKTGSTSFVGVAYQICATNQFHVLHLNVTKNQHIMSLADQMRFIQDVTGWKKPALYHGHIAFLDFTKFGLSGASKPLYINVIRRPFDRLVSYYYFMRNGDDYRPHIRRRKHRDRQSFDECVRRGGSDCDPTNLWMQIPFFCGQSAKCWEPGSEWALAEAKTNLVREYFLVGLTEELAHFIAILEITLPKFFHGAFEIFNGGNRSHLRRTTNKIEPLPETILKIKSSKIWQMEEEFYDFAYDHFQMIKRKTLVWSAAKSRFVAREKQFHFEKIGPSPASASAPTTPMTPEILRTPPPVEARVRSLVSRRRRGI